MTRLENALDVIAQLEAGATHEAADTSRLALAKCRGLIRGYDARWAAADFTADAVETVGVERLVNPSTGSISRKFRLAGKLDATGVAGGKRVVLDHKTTSEDIAPGSAYRAQLAIDGQAAMYMILELLAGRKADGAIWDLVRKPSISPREAKGETLDQYADRLAEDCTTVRPEWYFQRQAVVRTDAELVEFAEEAWGQSKEILRARNANAWSRNPGACMQYHTPCRFLSLCAGHDTPESGNWRRREWVHRELPVVGGKAQLLTHSRIRLFQTCRRKHLYQYEMGLERAHEEGESEALWFGTLWHLVLEAWLKGGTQ